MLGKRSRPSVRKSKPDPIITTGGYHRGSGSGRHDPAAVLSPTSPLERDPRSPKGWKNRESDGVGLGIVAALEKSGGGSGGEVSAKIVSGFNFNALSSSPISVISPRTADKVRDFLEGRKDRDDGRTGATTDTTASTVHELGFFCASPPTFTDEYWILPAADFLNSCFLCRKKLHGKDIYMYRGEKAFCSMECRYLQIVSDEYQEKCGSEVSKPSDIPSSDYSAAAAGGGGGRLFYTSIAAA